MLTKLDYKQRWEVRANHPAVNATYHPGDPLNQDPYVSQEKRCEYDKVYAKAVERGLFSGTSEAQAHPSSASGGVVELGKTKRSIRVAETHQALKIRITELAQQYLNSFPGDDTKASNTGSGQVIMRILAENHPQASEISMERIEKLLPIIKYRMNLMSTADEPVKCFGLQPPESKLCAQFYMDPYESEENWDEVFDVAKMILVGDETSSYPSHTKRNKE